VQYKVIIALTSGRVSGVDVFAVTLLRGLLKSGIPSKIVLTDHGASEVDAMPLPDDIPIDRLALSQPHKGKPRLRPMLDYLHDQGPCVYLPNYDYRHSTVCAKLRDQVAAIGIVHSDDPMHYTHTVRLGRYWNAIVAVSSKIHQTVAAIDDSFRDRLVTIPYGVPVPDNIVRAESTSGMPLRMLYVGRMEQAQKRVFRLIDILDLMEKRGIPCILTLVGGGAAAEEFRARAAAHIASGRVRFAGILPNHAVGREYLRNDVFLLTSAFEGFPVSLLEAMAHGCVPVVLRTESGIPELIRDGDNGQTIAEGDFGCFADHLAALYADRRKRAEMSQRARATIIDKGYGSDRMVNDYRRLFQRVFDDLQGGCYRRRRSRLPLDLFGYPLSRSMERVVSRLRKSWATGNA
jgi:glycosyltransferase involved in cell wall biosynthesis